MRGLRNWWRRHINDWDEICTKEEARFRTNIIFCTLLVSCISLAMFIFNLVRLSGAQDAVAGYRMMGFLALLFTVYCGLFFIQLFSAKYQRWVAWIFGFTALGMCVYLLYWGGPGGYGFLWMFIVPHVAVMVVPMADNIFYNVMLLATMVILLDTPLNKVLFYEYDPVFKALFPIALLCVICCVYLAEMVRYRTQHRLQKTANQMSSFAFTDPLTGVYNRRALVSHFGEIKTAASQGLAFAIFDLDFFKVVNDTYGHFVGDRVLQHIVQLAGKTMPHNATLYRWGGEEFLLVMKTDEPGEVNAVLEEIRRVVADTPLQSDEGEVNITVSMGAVCGMPSASIHQCISGADECLYRAKNEGRNRVVMDEPLVAKVS